MTVLEIILIILLGAALVSLIFLFRIYARCRQELPRMNEERARLDKNIAKVRKDLEASEKKLNNPNFVSRAKPEVVETERARVESGRAELEKLEKARAQLG